jgi:hypothetical protein
MNELLLLPGIEKPKAGITTLISEDKIELSNIIDRLILQYSLFDDIYIVETKSRTNLYLYAEVLRSIEETIIDQFKNIHYCRPISIYQISMVIESADKNAPIVIPNFLIPFTDEGVTEIEKHEQYNEIKKILITSSQNRPIIVGCRLDKFKGLEWLYKDLQVISSNFQTIISTPKLKEENKSSYQFKLF